jgi:hypothetical protein
VYLMKYFFIWWIVADCALPTIAPIPAFPRRRGKGLV